MSYTGTGQRLLMTAYAAGQSATTHYTLDTQQYNAPLIASSDGKDTVFLYGLSPIAEKTETWGYMLSDVSNTPRQLTDSYGRVTLSGSYTPWGSLMEYDGKGNFVFGYFGGLMDSATGLMYLGNGQYYDPLTGRFLTRKVNPESPNPYVPWNPMGGMVAPIGLVSIFFSRKKKSGLNNRAALLALTFLVLANLACCEQDNTNQPTQEPETPETGVDDGNAGTEVAEQPIPTVTPNPTPTVDPCENGQCALQQPIVILNCGLSEGSDPEKYGMPCRGQSNPGQLGPHKGWWEEKIVNVDVEYFDFPGNSGSTNGDGKRAQADNAIAWLSEKGANQSTQIYFGGYSAGGDSAILEAHDAYFIHGWDIQGLYLIDPGYRTKSVSADQLTVKIQELVNAGVPVTVHDAHTYMENPETGVWDQINPDSILHLDKKINGSSFFYRYEPFYNHYYMDDIEDQAKPIFEESYTFITTH